MSEQTALDLDLARKKMRRERMRRGGIYGLETPLFDVVRGMNADVVRKQIDAPIGDEVATKLAALINRFYGPRYVGLALNKVCDAFQSFWKRKRPKERTPAAADRVADYLIEQIEANVFELEWWDYRNVAIFELQGTKRWTN